MKRILPITNAVIAIAAGVLVLLGYFFPGPFGGIQSILLGWAIILAGFALLLGIFNLAMVHWNKIASKTKDRGYSIVLLVSLVLTILLVSYSGPSGSISVWIVNNLQVPAEVSLIAVLSIVLLYSVTRLLTRRPKWYTILFLVTVVLVMLGSVPLYFIGEISVLTTLRTWLTQVPAVAGARGLLLGVALGTVAAGLRVLIGVDRPYGG